MFAEVRADVHVLQAQGSSAEVELGEGTDGWLEELAEAVAEEGLPEVHFGYWVINYRGGLEGGDFQSWGNRMSGSEYCRI